MIRNSNIIVIAALIITVGMIAFWQLTGGDYYTKFEVIEEVKQELDADDPLLAAGFYDDKEMTKTVKKDEFHLGLLPTPSGIFDKHVISVVSVLVPIWILTLVVKIWHRIRRRFI